jgi:hypothetical protein
LTVEIQKAGWEALKKQLGLAGTLRFLLQYEKGEGDYTKLKRKYFKGKTVKGVMNEMRKEKKIRQKGKLLFTFKDKPDRRDSNAITHV